VCFLFISILPIKDFQNCSIATKIVIDKPNNAMFCFSLESPQDGYFLPPHPIFMFSGALIDSIFFCIDIVSLPGTVHLQTIHDKVIHHLLNSAYSGPLRPTHDGFRLTLFALFLCLIGGLCATVTLKIDLGPKTPQT
jgi:hypothetical protein